jgi:hypothetical protein
MKSRGFLRCCFIALSFVSCFAGRLPFANAIPSFQSPDWRLPNPDKPYEMTSGTVTYDGVTFALYDLTFQASNPQQLDAGKFNAQLNRWEFDSTFDVTFTAVVSRGLEPSHPIIGGGTAHAIGVTRPGEDPQFGFVNPQVFDMELLSLNLIQHTTRPELGIMLRESPTLQSKGVTIREDPCPMCAAPFSHWIISSFFDINTEVSLNGGSSWSSARDAIHVEQAPDGYQPGDYNKDKIVATADYIVWRRTHGDTGAGLAADGDWSGAVDAGDFRVWRANIGRSANSGSGSAAVPEPLAIVLMMAGLMLMPTRQGSGFSN